MKKLALIILLIVGIIAGYCWMQRPSQKVFAHSSNPALTFLEDSASTLWENVKELGFDLHALTALHDNATAYASYCADCKQLADRYAQGKTVSTETIRIAQEVMNDMQIAPEAITILPWSYDSHAATIAHYLFINASLFDTLSLRAKKFCIAHELTHFLNKDHYMVNALRSIAGRAKIDKSKEEKAVSCFQKFVEYRADIMAALVSPEYAQGGIEFHTGELQELGDISSPDHPKPSQRLAWMQTVQEQIIA